MIAAAHQEDNTKPSRIHRRRKKRWRKTSLMNYYRAAITKPLNPLSFNPRQKIVLTPGRKLDYSDCTTKRYAVPASVRLAVFLCLKHRHGHNLTVMARLRGANKACPNNPRRRIAVVEAAPPLLKVAQSLTKRYGVSKMTNQATQGNYAQNQASSQSKYISLFNLIKRTPEGRQLICQDLTFAQAVALVAEIPAAIVKFSRMEAAR